MDGLSVESGRTARYGFIAWNEFQVLHFAELLKRVPNAVVLLVEDRATEAFMEMASHLSEAFPVKTMAVRHADLASLDGFFDGIFSQTDFKGSHRFRSTPLFALQYSLAKETHQYGAWHVNFRAAFCYGEYSARRLAYACSTFACGHPRLSGDGASLDEALVEEYRARLDPGKPTLLYAPTWGAGSLVESFLGDMDWIGERYNVIVRPHHNTMSRESMRLGMVEIPARPAFVDDFAIQCSLADVVVSDYSGAIFDALYLGKPVALFRDGRVAEEGISSFSVDSIEVARQDDIGPIAGDVERLREILEGEREQVFSPYRERNATLLEECFTSGGSAAARILEILQSPELDALRHPQQEWVRVYVDKRLRAAKVGGKPRNKARKKRHVARRGEKRGVRVLLSGAKAWVADRLLSERRFLLPYLRLMSRFKSPEYRAAASDLLAGIGEFREAAEIRAADVRAAQSISDAFFRLWIKEPGNRFSAARARDFGSLFDASRLAPIAVLRRGICTGDLGDAERVVEAAREDATSGNLRRVVNGLSVLMTFRRYNEIERIVDEQPALLGSKHVRDALGRIARTRLNFEGRQALADQAEARSVGGGAVATGHALDVYLPPHFFVPRSNKILKMRGKNWEQVRKLHGNILAALEESGEIPFGVRYQYFLNFVERRDDATAISFFTKNGGLRNWHLKDIGIGTLASLDPDGYFSSSMLARIATDRFKALLRSIEPDPGIFTRCERLLLEHGGDKYRQLSAEQAGPGISDYVFVALQSTKGLEETFQPIERLIDVLAAHARKSGRRIVFKRHPLCEDILITRALARAAAVDTVLVSNADTWQLVKGSSAVVTVNSGVALQAIAACRHLVISGPSETAVVANVASDFQGIPALLEGLATHAPDVDAYARFLTFYFDGYLIDPSDHPGIIDRLKGILEIDASASSPDEKRARYLDFLVEGMRRDRRPVG